MNINRTNSTSSIGSISSDNAINRVSGNKSKYFTTTESKEVSIKQMLYPDITDENKIKTMWFFANDDKQYINNLKNDFSLKIQSIDGNDFSLTTHSIIVLNYKDNQKNTIFLPHKIERFRTHSAYFFQGYDNVMVFPNMHNQIEELHSKYPRPLLSVVIDGSNISNQEKTITFCNDNKIPYAII